MLFAICYTFNPAFVLVRKNQYDGIEEFWVDVRTTGSAEYMEKNTERESKPGLKLVKYLVQFIYCHPNSFETSDPITEPDRSEKQRR